MVKSIHSHKTNKEKQRWDFSDEYEHTQIDATLAKLETPRRLSWRECALIQTFVENFEPAGKVEAKFTQIGNAVPPLLAETIIRHLISGKGLLPRVNIKTTKQLNFWD